MYCNKCGNEIDDKSEFCSKCGTKTGQNNSVNESKVKIKKNNKGNKILLIILLLLIHLILFAAGTRAFLSTELVTANVIYPVKQSAITGLTTRNEYECNLLYEYKGIEYHDTITFNDDNLPKEVKNSSKDPNFFDVKLKGYVYKDNADNFILDMEYYNIAKYVFYIQVILIIPSIVLIIRSIIGLIKNKTNNKKGINKAVLIAIICLIAFIVVGVIFFISKNKNLSNNKDNTPVDWGLTINGTSIILPCSFDELTKVDVNVNEGFYEELITTTNQTFSGSYAFSDGWPQGIYLDLKTSKDVSKKEENVTISGIRYYLPAHSFDTTLGITPDKSSLLTSSQFSIKNNITIGSKSEDVIEAFGTDYEPKSETNLNSLYSLIYYKKGNSTLTIGFENGFVREIIITTTNLNISKKESYDFDNSSQDNSLSNSNEKNEVETTIQEETNNNSDDNIDREELLNNFKFYRERGFYEFTEKEYADLKTYSNAELQKKWDKISKIVETQGEYDAKYGEQLNNIFKKTLNVELNSSEDNLYVYTPSTKTQPKARVEYVSINENGIKEIYYSVEMTLTITDKQQNKSKETTTKKYYKTTNINELDNIIKINNYDTQAIQDEIDTAIASVEKPIQTAHLSAMQYNFTFYYVGEYVLYYLSEEGLEWLNEFGQNDF